MNQSNLLTIEALIRQLLTEIGEDPTREGLRDTPRRIARFWEEWLGYEDDNLETTFEPPVIGQMIVVRDVKGWSLCEHHLLPFSFTAHVGYLSNAKVIGLSKIPRIVQKHAHKLQLQERLTKQIAEDVRFFTMSRGVAVLVKGYHTCMAMRGIKSDGTVMVTSHFTDAFEEAALRQEFLKLLEV